MANFFQRDWSFAEYLFDVCCTTFFAYLLLDSITVLLLNGYPARISLMNFLIPHASKVLIWTLLTLVVLRPRFGWRFPLAFLMLYCTSELITNWIWVFVHLWWPWEWSWVFLSSQTWFFMGLYLGYMFLKGHYEFKLDWAVLPWAFFVFAWVLQGYWTESNIFPPTIKLEVYEFTWNVLYLLMAYNVFQIKKEADDYFILTPSVG